MSTMFLTAKEIADILKISKSLAYRLISKGQITSIRFGRVSRVRQEDLDIFIQRCVMKLESNHTAGTPINDVTLGKGDVQQTA